MRYRGNAEPLLQHREVRVVFAKEVRDNAIVVEGDRQLALGLVVLAHAAIASQRWPTGSCQRRSPFSVSKFLLT